MIIVPTATLASSAADKMSDMKQIRGVWRLKKNR